MTKRAPLTFKVDPVTKASTAKEQTALPASTQTRKQKKDKAKPGRDGRQFIACHVVPEAAKQFKLLAIQTDKTTQELLIDAINDTFAKHGLSRIA